jgi:molybdate-binding protein
LVGYDVEALDDGQVRSVGASTTGAATTDIVDACVVEGASRRRGLVVSSDSNDLQSIASAVDHRLEIDDP